MREMENNIFVFTIELQCDSTCRIALFFFFFFFFSGSSLHLQFWMLSSFGPECQLFLTFGIS